MSVKRGGLGKSLSALLSTQYTDEVTPVDKDVSSLMTLALDVLQPGKFQPRTAIDDIALQELADSIKQQGLLQPIIVRSISDKRYEIIAGERRWRACQLAGLQEIPVLLRQVDDETTMAMALVENLQRENLNPIDQARSIARLTDEFNLTHQQVADLLSKSRASISNFIRLLSLSDGVIRYLEHGDLDMGHARALLSLEQNKQLEVASLIVAKNLSVRETEKLVNRVKEGPQVIAKQPLDSLMPAFPLEKLEHILQTRVTIKPGKAGKSTLLIHFDSNNVLENTINRMMKWQEEY